MTNSIALPEAVRGCWYLVSSSFELDGGLPRDRELLAFDRDGTFRRYDIEDGDRTSSGEGDYNFDGDFLILRGDRTKTYRVGRHAVWYWELEGKNKTLGLYRGFVEGDGLDEIPKKVCRDIQLLPRRARIEADFEGEDVIYRVVYDGDQGERRQLGSLSVRRGDSNLWVGVTPLVRGIEPSIWGQIVRESFLDGYLEVSGRRAVTVDLFDSDDTLRF